jgi:pimeloyl-ACP methyl ester carboxylesterase
MSNYERNVSALASRFRVLIPDLPATAVRQKICAPTIPPAIWLRPCWGCSTHWVLQARTSGNSLGGACALRMALDQPPPRAAPGADGPGGIGIADASPTDGIKRLLGYYAGEGPSLEKLRTFICEDLVFDAGQVTEAPLRALSGIIQPDVLANPPLRIPPDPAAFRRLDFLLDPRLSRLEHPTLVLWGVNDRVNRPDGAAALQRQAPRCDVYLFSRTGHWVQWERAAEFNAVLAAFLAEDHGA